MTWAEAQATLLLAIGSAFGHDQRDRMNAAWKIHVFALNAVLFALLGLLVLATHWEGISIWWTLTSRPYDEVRDSPMEAVWSSGKIVPAMLFLAGGALNALHWLHLRIRDR